MSAPQSDDRRLEELERSNARQRRTIVLASVVAGVAVLAIVAIAVTIAADRDAGPAEVAEPSGTEASENEEPSSEAPTSETPSSPSPSPSPTTASPSASPTQSAQAAAQEVCGAPIPEGAARAVVGDLDGDGREDEAFLEGSQLWAETRERVSAPYDIAITQPPLTISTADADSDGRSEFFVQTQGGSGLDVILLKLDGCELRPVQNAEGEPYLFLTGTDPDNGDLLGLGCVDVDGNGSNEVVGTRARQLQDGTYEVERTVVDIDGLEARNGSTDTVFVSPDDERAVATLDTATCGERPLDDIFEG